MKVYLTTFCMLSALIIPSKAVMGQTSGAQVWSLVQPDMTTHNSPLACDGEIKYTPWPAFPASNYTVVSISSDGKLVSTAKTWPEGTADKNKLLPNISTQIAMSKIEGSGSAAGFWGASAEAKRIVIDFMKYRSEAIKTTDDAIFAYGRIGAGMRLTIDLETIEANLGGNLMAIALSAKAGKTTGTISVDVVGLNATDITLSMPFTTDISDGSIQKIIEALAVVKSKLNDPNTTLDPQFLAKINCVPKATKTK